MSQNSEIKVKTPGKFSRGPNSIPIRNLTTRNLFLAEWGRPLKRHSALCFGKLNGVWHFNTKFPLLRCTNYRTNEGRGTGEEDVQKRKSSTHLLSKQNNWKTQKDLEQNCGRWASCSEVHGKLNMMSKTGSNGGSSLWQEASHHEP